MALPGQYVLIRYDVPGPELWHERLITGTDANNAGWCAMLTPDQDHYAEEISLEVIRSSVLTPTALLLV